MLKVGLLDKASHDYDILKKTVFIEAKHLGFEGKTAVAWTIYNRCRRNPLRWGRTIAGVCLKGQHTELSQFECWKHVSKIREMEAAIRFDRRGFAALDTWLPSVYKGRDPTARIGGADHYFNPDKEKRENSIHQMRIEDFVFYRE